ncbi:SDR family NAD(P)-dependent oxidoreductase [Planctobacterium marinum]|uniref:Short-chain dehydrogenase n=1 Tax=Planctobacterium marinum TaxID=1631968 RepID=A0AA48KR11_9ALTE|nr:short-chain dehydrogenase [Planctobacterium marinum]
MAVHADLNLTLITGASEGIGRCFAEEFARQGHDLVLVARSQEKLEAMAESLRNEHSVKVTVLPQDLTQPGAAEVLAAQLQERQLQVDILVNNAGLMYVQDFFTTEPEKLEQLLTLNINAVVRMTRQFLPQMLSRDNGKIINVASIASFIPTPKFAIYGASKAFVLSFTEALVEEIKYTNVKAHCVCPGFTKTNMIQQGNGLEDNIPGFMKVAPESLVKDAYKSVMKGETIYIHKIHNKALVQWSRLYPKWLVRGVSGFFSRF